MHTRPRRGEASIVMTVEFTRGRHRLFIRKKISDRTTNTSRDGVTLDRRVYIRAFLTTSRRRPNAVAPERTCETKSRANTSGDFPNFPTRRSDGHVVLASACKVFRAPVRTTPRYDTHGPPSGRRATLLNLVKVRRETIIYYGLPPFRAIIDHCARGLFSADDFRSDECRFRFTRTRNNTTKCFQTWRFDDFFGLAESPIVSGNTRNAELRNIIFLSYRPTPTGRLPVRRRLRVSNPNTDKTKIRYNCFATLFSVARTKKRPCRRENEKTITRVVVDVVLKARTV